MSQPASFPSPGGQAENQGTAAFAADPIQTQNGGADAPASSKDSKKKGKKTVAGPRRVRPQRRVSRLTPSTGTSPVRRPFLARRSATWARDFAGCASRPSSSSSHAP